MLRIKDGLMKVSWIAVFLVISTFTMAAGEAPVEIWEEPLVIPSYKVGEPDPNPIFFHGRTYQGAKGVVYPYPFMDNLTDIREDKTYSAVYLENRYLKVCVLPQIGGRIFYAVDKTNGYNFFYRQHVIKPALIGVLGAWISGGVEWNVPHHHRASTFMPVDYTLEENPDGSKTVWVGEIELRHRLKWLVGLTLYPEKSYIEVSVKIFNRTPFVHTLLYWANAAVHADSTYQVIFPPSLEYATGHGKHRFTTWPVSSNVFNRPGYAGGVDLSWWKNHPSPISLFAFDCKEDFIAGYNHGRRAGVVHVADYHIVPGKKLWEWGPCSVGRMWDKILTETDGPYIEIMVGAYSDNQPDYSWIQPYEVKTFKHYWYPLREIGGVKKANLEAAVNLELTPQNVARIGFNTSAEYPGARVLLEAGDEIILEQRMDISPEKPFFKETTLPQGIKEKDLKLSLFSSAGEELITYRPVAKKGTPMPEPVEAPPPPQEIKTIEELYFTAQRLEQFHNAALEPDPYYEEALTRDPGDYRVNTALGILYCKRGLFKEAEEKLRTAIKRITRNHTKPRDGEAYYYLGVACKAQGHYDEAYEAFYKATWSHAWYSAGFYSLAELAALKRDFPKALEFLERSISTNALNNKALNLKAAVLRRLGRYEEAVTLASRVLAMDPLDFRAQVELSLAKSDSGLSGTAIKQLNALRAYMGDAEQSFLEAAVEYGNCGLWEEAIEVLSLLVDPDNGKVSTNPMVYYYLGYFHERKGDSTQASRYYRVASSMSPDYVFPHRLESIDVLRAAIEDNPADARAPYYLGNLLYDNQPENAIKEWERSRQLDDTFSIVHRNLALGYARIQNNIPKAVASLEAAIACNRNDPRLYLELDQLYQMQGVSSQKRLAFLENNQDIVDTRDYLLSRQIALYVQLEQYDKAIDLLSNHHFHVWEGGGKIHDLYVDAHLLRGEKYFREGDYQAALADFEAAGEYPENLEVGRPLQGGPSSQVYYFIATVYEALGDSMQASTFYEKSVAEKHPPLELTYYQGLAYRKLGKEERAQRVFEHLVEFGRKQLETGSGKDYFLKFGEKQSEEARMADAHYLMGLGYLGKGEREKARLEFEKALKLNVNHRKARTQLSMM